MTSFKVGDTNFVISFMKDEIFEAYTEAPVADTSKGTEIMATLQVRNPEDVNTLLIKAAKAGGLIFAPATWKDGWMYGGGFSDLDGHRWSVLFMDFEKLAQRS